MEQNILPLIAAFLYVISGFLTSNRLLGEQSTKLSKNLPLIIGFVALFFHSIIIYQSTILMEGFNLGVFNAFSLVSFSIVAILLFSALSKPVENLGIILLPLAAITIILQLRYPGILLLDSNARWGLKIHVLISIIAYSLLTLASVQSILLAIIDKQLHDRKPGRFVRAMPTLETMQALLFEMISVGFILLTAALLSGFFYLENMFAQHLVHKTVLSIVSWVVFATLLWGRFKFGWRGRVAIHWTLWGFASLMLAYFGSKIVLEILLK